MENNFNYVEHTDELKSVTSKGNKAIQLTPRSYSRIIGKVSKWTSNKNDKLAENNIPNVEESSHMIQPEQIKNSEKTMARVQNIINFLEEKDIINSNNRLNVLGSKPIRLMPKMFEAPYSIYTVARSKFTIAPEKTNDNVKDDKVDTDVIADNNAIKLSKEHEEQMAKRLEEEISKVYAELKEESAVKENSEVVENEKEPVENTQNENNNSEDLSSFEEVKQNYLNIMNRVREQNNSLEKADQELKAAEQAKINAEAAKKEAMNRLIAQTILQQQILEDTMKKESEINRQISAENEQTEMLNKETEELLAMLTPEEDKATQKVA